MIVPQMSHLEVCPALASFLVIITVGDTLPPNPRFYIALAVGIALGRVLGRAAAVCLSLSRSPKFLAL